MTANKVLMGPEADAFVPPQGWACLPPGDAGLTRRVKAAGPTVTLQEKKGRKVFSRGVWADAQQIEKAKAEMEAMRSTAAYQKKKVADQKRRDAKQEDYTVEFLQAVLEFLDFAPNHAALARRLAKRVTAHATPVGSGTVARTQRIPIEKRASAAVIAWMRHQTTAYDDMKIARIKGERRAVRAQLAAQSRKLLERYRQGKPLSNDCPLYQALHTEAA